MEIFSLDVVHVPRQKLHTLDDLASSKYRRDVTAQLRSESTNIQHGTGKTLSRVDSEGGASTGLRDLEGFEESGDEDGSVSPRVTNISEAEVFGDAGSDSSGDEGSGAASDDVPEVMVHKYARLSRHKRQALPRRSAPAVKRSHSAMSKGNASTASGDSHKTAVISSKRMCAVLGYDQTAPTRPDADSPETSAAFRKGKRPAPMMQASSVVAIDDEFERRAVGDGSGACIKIGRAPKVSYRSATDA